MFIILILFYCFIINCMITDSQIFIALLFALVSAVLAIRLGADLYQ